MDFYAVLLELLSLIRPSYFYLSIKNITICNLIIPESVRNKFLL
jgi:hypothetical protein